MTVDHMSMVYNLFYIIILIVVCGCASLFALWLNKRMKFKYWVFSTVYFVGITFTTITLWYLTIGFTF